MSKLKNLWNSVRGQKKEEAVTEPTKVIPAEPVKIRKSMSRYFDAARMNATLNQWGVSNFQSIDWQIEHDLAKLRDRSRDAALNNPYVKRYLQVLEDNVVGAHGIQLKMDVRNIRNQPDVNANRLIEADWKLFTKSVTPNCMNMRELASLAIKSVARDGEVFIVRRRGGQFGKFAINYQVFESDWVPHRYNLTVDKDKIYIRNGIQYDEYGCPTYYFISTQNPKELKTNPLGYKDMEYEKIPAKDVIHLYDPEFVHQGRGFPWTHAALTALHHLKEYTDSEQIKARVAACLMGFYTKPEGEEGIPISDEDKERYGIVQEMSPGSIHELPEGWKVEFLNPNAPTANFESFQKAVLMSAASALGISYMTLSVDAGSANYSSARVGMLDERENYRRLQQWMIERLYTPIFEDFLKNTLLLTPANVQFVSGMTFYDKYNAPKWRPRTWIWVDPQKEMNAAQTEINNLLVSRSEIMRQQGRDPDQVFNEIAEENEKMRALGITPEQVDNNLRATAQQMQEEQDSEDSED